MNYLPLLLVLYLLVVSVHAGPQDKWVYVGSSNSFDGTALLLAIGAFAWLYIIYRDFKGARRRK